MAITTIEPAGLQPIELHKLLLGSIAPRPIALASTISSDGTLNLGPFSFFNVVSANPPLLIISSARKLSDNSFSDTFENIKEVPEMVVNMVNFPIIEKVSHASHDFSREVNEFDRVGFTAITSDVVRPPRVMESPISYECKVDRVIELGKEPGAGNLILAKVEKIHVQRKYIKDNGSIDHIKMEHVGRMGESIYCKINAEALFEIDKMEEDGTLGINQLPRSIRNSNVLKGKHLEQLGHLTRLSTMDEINRARTLDEVKQVFLEFENQRDLIKEMLHRLGAERLGNGAVKQALAIMSIVDHI